jgi:4-amino-4-deoxy-L-arabinose transferase-like glycosyltransferase
MSPSSSCLSTPSGKSASTGDACCTWWRDLILITVITGLWFCALLGVRPLSNPDEGRYTEIPREMAVTGDFVTPRLNGVKYFEKPPLVYWLSALTFRQFGVSEFTARLWGGLFSIFGVLLTYSAARLIYDRRTGIWSAIVLSTSLFYYILSQIMLLDMAVAVTMSGALFSFILAMREPRGKRRFGLFMSFYAFMALATLSKGLIGFAIPGAVIFLWVLLLNRWRALWPFYPLLGTVLLLAIAAPWHILASQANHSAIQEYDFAWFYFVHEHWLRFTTRIHGRFEPWWFFLPTFLVGLFPWIFFAKQTLRNSLVGGWKARSQNAEAWFFLIWVVFIIAFFSRSQSKLIPYILPVFPACAVLIGRSMSGLWQGLADSSYRKSGWAFIVTCLLLVAAISVYPAPKDQPEICAYLPILRVTLGGALLLGAGTTFLALRRKQPRLMIGAIAISSTIFLLGVNAGAGSLDKTSTEKLAKILKPMLKPQDRVYSVGFYCQDLPPYLERLVSVVDYRGELAFGIDAEPEITSKRFLDRDGFVSQWAEPGTAYAVVRKSYYDKWFPVSSLPYDVIAQTNRFVLVVKRNSQP